MGEESSTYGGEKCLQGLGAGGPEETIHYEEGQY